MLNLCALVLCWVILGSGCENPQATHTRLAELKEIAEQFLSHFSEDAEVVFLEAENIWTCPESTQEKFSGRMKGTETTVAFEVEYSINGQTHMGEFKILQEGRYTKVMDVSLPGLHAEGTLERLKKDSEFFVFHFVPEKEAAKELAVQVLVESF